MEKTDSVSRAIGILQQSLADVSNTRSPVLCAEFAVRGLESALRELGGFSSTQMPDNREIQDTKSLVL